MHIKFWVNLFKRSTAPKILSAWHHLMIKLEYQQGKEHPQIAGDLKACQYGLALFSGLVSCPGNIGLLLLYFYLFIQLTVYYICIYNYVVLYASEGD